MSRFRGGATAPCESGRSLLFEVGHMRLIINESQYRVRAASVILQFILAGTAVSPAWYGSVSWLKPPGILACFSHASAFLILPSLLICSAETLAYDKDGSTECGESGHLGCS